MCLSVCVCEGPQPALVGLTLHHRCTMSDLSRDHRPRQEPGEDHARPAPRSRPHAPASRSRDHDEAAMGVGRAVGAHAADPTPPVPCGAMRPSPVAAGSIAPSGQRHRSDTTPRRNALRASVRSYVVEWPERRGMGVKRWDGAVVQRTGILGDGARLQGVRGGVGKQKKCGTIPIVRKQANGRRMTARWEAPADVPRCGHDLRRSRRDPCDAEHSSPAPFLSLP